MGTITGEQKAIVKKNPERGPRGMFCKVMVEGIRRWATCSLEPPVWKDSRLPKRGQLLMVVDVRWMGEEDEEGRIRSFGPRIIQEARFWDEEDEE